MTDFKFAILVICLFMLLTLHAVHVDEKRKKERRRKHTQVLLERRKKARRRKSRLSYIKWLLQQKRLGS